VRIGPDNTVTPLGVQGYHPPQSPPTVTIQTVDENGQPVTRVVPKAEAVGKTYAKAPNATTANRVASAKAVTQVGNDIMEQLSDPQIAAMLGPSMGRYNNLQEFLGSPPPEFAQLAGEIESFALANMGVHGMRSTQGAQQIKDLLSAKHTPASLIAAIKGLSNFSQHFMENETPKATGKSGAQEYDYVPGKGLVPRQ
jgi:hypothetical protein